MKEVKFASSERAEVLKEQIDMIMDFLGIEVAFMSDETKFWDFGLEEEDMLELQEKFGLPVKSEDNVVDFALLIKQKGETCALH